MITGQGVFLSRRSRRQGRVQFAFISTLAGGKGRISWIRAEKGAPPFSLLLPVFVKRDVGRARVAAARKDDDLFEFRLRLLLLAVNVATQQDGDLEGFYAIS
jgi:hypothetical protein